MKLEEKEYQLTKSDNYMGNLYFNAFNAGFSNSDVSIDLMLNIETLLTLNMSFGTMKSLRDALDSMVSDIENRAGHILSINEFEEKMTNSFQENE